MHSRLITQAADLLPIVTLAATILCGQASAQSMPAPGGEETPATVSTRTTRRFQIPLPPAEYYYHGVFPGTRTGEEDSVTQIDLSAYERSVRKHAALVCFSNEWFRSRAFPAETVGWIHAAGSIPYIRLMLRSDPELRHAEPRYTLRRIIRGDFDDDLRSWARSARACAFPLVVEYGTEVNGNWFSWNAAWNDGGAKSFQRAYRHLIGLMRAEHADNITWVFHVNGCDEPEVQWNRLEEYYPGDSWIDWLAVSVYGAQTPMDRDWPEFSELMDSVYPRLIRLAPAKPVIVAEFGVTAGNNLGSQSTWAEHALTALSSSRWPQVIAFSWWNSAWRNDRISRHNSDMRVQDNPDLGKVFRTKVGLNPRILGNVPGTEKKNAEAN